MNDPVARYQNVYGLRSPSSDEEDLSVVNPFDGQEVWFLTGSQHLYGEETLQQVAEQSQRIASALDTADEVPVRVVWKPVLTDAGAIRRAMREANEDARCLGVITWMHTFSPAKMWLTGLDALRKPLLHLHTQADAALPWATIDMDFMNLNQAAHGDREYGFVLTRLRVPRTTVAGHADNPRVRARIGSWARAAAGAAAARDLRVARFGDNMRNVAVTEGDKVEAEIRFGMSVNTWGVNDLVAAVDAVADKAVDASGRRSTATSTRWTRPWPRAGRSMRPCATRPASRRRCAGSWPTAASAPSPPTSRTSAACASCPAWPYSG